MKSIDTIHLDLHIFYNEKLKRNKNVSAVDFFCGGACVSGVEKAKEAAPILFISKNTPLTLIFHGTDDQTEPASVILNFKKK